MQTNGGENRGEFYRALSVNGINRVYITPHCHFQNGKIKRLWPSIEYKKISWKQIGRWFAKYNTKHHTTLPTHRVNGKTIHFSPLMCWKINDMWRQGKQAKWIVDGVEQDFLPDGRRAEDIPDIHIREEGNTDEERESEHSNEEDIDE